MPYTLEFTPAALRDLKQIPKQILFRIGRKIDSLTDNPRPPGVEKLTGSENSYRIRVGHYRILYEIRDKGVLINIVRARHRREAYRN